MWMGKLLSWKRPRFRISQNNFICCGPSFWRDKWKFYRFFFLICLVIPLCNTSEKPGEHWMIVWWAPKYHKNEGFLLSCDETSAAIDTTLEASLFVLPVVFMGAMNVRKEMPVSELPTAGNETDTKSTGKPQTSYWFCMRCASVLC